MPKEERCLDGAKFPNEFPPSSQIKIRQIPKQNFAIFPNRTPPNDRTKYRQLGD